MNLSHTHISPLHSSSSLSRRSNDTNRLFIQTQVCKTTTIHLILIWHMKRTIPLFPHLVVESNGKFLHTLLQIGGVGIHLLGR